MKDEYYLESEFDARKSFYKKARVVVSEDDEVLHKELLNYGTLVANYVKYKTTRTEVFEYFGKYSQTTTRHQKEFFRQLGLTEKELKELMSKGSINKLF